MNNYLYNEGKYYFVASTYKQFLTKTTILAEALCMPLLWRYSYNCQTGAQNTAGYDSNAGYAFRLKLYQKDNLL